MADSPPAQFQRVVTLAFSADPAPGVQRREHSVVTLESTSRRLQLAQDFTWRTLVDALRERLQPGTLVAVDFPLSFPRGFVAHDTDADTDAPESWAAALEWAHVHGELTLAAGRSPFWGRHGVSRPKTPALGDHGLASLNRATERTYRPAKSVFQVAGPDAVGTAALRGMAWLRRSELRPQLHAWPFDGPAPADNGAAVLAEVLPRAFWPDIRIQDPAARRARIAELRDSGYDATNEVWAAAERPFPFKAVTAACGLAELLARDPDLLHDPARAPVTDPALRYEGWCLGPEGAPPAGEAPVGGS